MSKTEYKQRARQRRANWLKRRAPQLFAGVLGIVLLGAVGAGAICLGGPQRNPKPASANAAATQSQTSPVTPSQDITAASGAQQQETAQPKEDTSVRALLEKADRIAAGYDYDQAIELLQTDPLYGTDTKIDDAINHYNEIKSTLVPYDIDKITHIFFHSLIIDKSKAFDGDSKQTGYNQMMATKDEFLKILQSMYDRGYVLVKIHDMAYEATDENGKAYFKKGKIMLPEGKKAFVMSQDDVCYYEYMEGDGFASRIIIGEDGKPTTEMKMEDGSVSVGDYDLVPILEHFIDEHPDFSYKGARAIIALTGYNGILGYRTAASYSNSPTYEQDKKDAAAVAQCLRDNGWELASHSWGHRHMGSIGYEDFVTDTDKWEKEVESLIGPTDIILYPFGDDIGNWHPYSNTNERYNYLKSKGFRYFCNVDSSKYWVQLGPDYLRQGRRDVDGYRMYYDLINPDPSKLKLNDLFDVAEVFDKDRPTPVPPM